MGGNRYVNHINIFSTSYAQILVTDQTKPLGLNLTIYLAIGNTKRAYIYVYVIVIPWVVGVYQNKCPCHEGAARVPGRLF